MLPKHLMVMLCCLLLIGWVDSIVPPQASEPAWRRWFRLKARMILGAFTGEAAICLFPGTSPSIVAPDGSTDFTGAQHSNLVGTLYMVVYLLPPGRRFGDVRGLVLDGRPPHGPLSASPVHEADVGRLLGRGYLPDLSRRRPDELVRKHQPARLPPQRFPHPGGRHPLGGPRQQRYCGFRREVVTNDFTPKTAVASTAPLCPATWP
ncbi:hypothetical protein [Streptomyces sp. 769]|uniref:hypothetical protein n=1 Tax=Streptomyces sp. 769 TaxID=1262452 RepID=UPI000581BDB1|nr:hypothetical protein [Streptomyces sp. 769]AJC54465.1 hypothetical protein GZL_01871 [Streptomyces sp. 769]